MTTASLPAKSRSKLGERRTNAIRTLTWLTADPALQSARYAEVLTLAKERKGQAVIDDEVARKTAKIYGIFYVGTPCILMRAVLEKSITKERAKQAVNDMVSSGWRCSVETYAKIIEAFEKT